MRAARGAEPAEVQLRVGKRGSWRKPDGGPERAYQLMREYPGVYEMRELFTAPTAVNVELLEALKYVVAVYDQGTCGSTVESAFNRARAAIAKAEGAKP